jgi:hypothetical protein
MDWKKRCGRPKRRPISLSFSRSRARDGPTSLSNYSRDGAPGFLASSYEEIKGRVAQSRKHEAIIASTVDMGFFAAKIKRIACRPPPRFRAGRTIACNIN